jgi:hypothetical protein
MEGSWNATLRRSSGFQPEPAVRQVKNLHDEEHRLKKTVLREDNEAKG